MGKGKGGVRGREGRGRKGRGREGKGRESLNLYLSFPLCNVLVMYKFVNL
jgi:hypothetical protein